jgi:helix-turn-helix protein/AraC-like protein
MGGPGDQRAVWARVSAPGGGVLDLMHTRVTQHFPPHVHGEFAVGACVEGVEAIRFRGQVYHSAPGSVVILEPGEPHTGGPSRYQVLRSFRDEVGMPPHAWLAQLRVARARKLLETGQRPAEAAAAAGFADQAHLTRWFRRVVGVTPGVYRTGVQDVVQARPAC